MQLLNRDCPYFKYITLRTSHSIFTSKVEAAGPGGGSYAVGLNKALSIGARGLLCTISGQQGQVTQTVQQQSDTNNAFQW